MFIDDERPMPPSVRRAMSILIREEFDLYIELIQQRQNSFLKL